MLISEILGSAQRGGDANLEINVVLVAVKR